MGPHPDLQVGVTVALDRFILRARSTNASEWLISNAPPRSISLGCALVLTGEQALDLVRRALAAGFRVSCL